MKKSIFFVIILGLLTLFGTGCNNGENRQDKKVELLISAASSLTDVLNEVKPLFEKENPDVNIIYNFGGSGNLSQQIEQGAPSNIFLSANQSFMNRLVNKGLILANTKVEFANNAMVLVTSTQNGTSIDSFRKLDETNDIVIAIGNPDVVPAGDYAKQILQSLHLWEKLQGKLVFAKNVRQVLAYIESGNAEVGIVYQSDSLISDKVKIIAKANPDWHQLIVYPGAVVKNSEHIDVSERFLAYLSSDSGKKIFEKYGFSATK